MLFLDIETYNEQPISVGSHKYAETAEVLLVGYAIDKNPAKVWDATRCNGDLDGMPKDLFNALSDGDCKIVMHNGMMFDSVVLTKRMIHIPVERVVDTMVIAYEHGLPGALADLCKVFGLSEDKSKIADGHRLVQLFCQPRPKNCKIHRATRHTHPIDWEKFIEYCRMDIVSMREIFYRLPKTNCTNWERAIQIADANINRRGIKMDLDLARGAMKLDAEFKENLRAKTKKATNGSVESATQRDSILKYIENTFHWKLESLTKAEIERKIDADEVPEGVKEILRLRLASASTSAKKYQRVIEAVSRDGRLRGTLQFRGAMRTGRFSGRLFQPQNLARPAFKEAGFFEAIDLIKSGYASQFYDDVKPVLSTCLRGLVVAPEGYLLSVADYSNIEGRVLAWLAGEDWKIKAFEAFDAGKGHDLYKMTYGRTFGIKPEDVTKPQRQMGKVLELAMGYGGGAGAFVTFADGYGLNLNKVADDIYAALDVENIHEATDSWDWFVKNNATCGLPKRTFIAVDAVKRAWRKANMRIVEYWGNVGEGVIAAINNPAEEFECGRIGKAFFDGRFLQVMLPSGRRLFYAKPRLSEDKKDSFTYLGVDQATRKWGRLESYSAKVVENIVQATSCDILCASLVSLERMNFRPVMHVHDEIVCEVKKESAEVSYNAMCEIMTHPGEAYRGLPLAVDGFIGDRYKKKD